MGPKLMRQNRVQTEWGAGRTVKREGLRLGALLSER